jgi:L-arabinose transport system permease protein
MLPNPNGFGRTDGPNGAGPTAGRPARQLEPLTVTRRLRGLWEEAGMLIVFLLLFLASALLVPNFLTWRNMQGLALAMSMVGMVACTMLFCLAAGHFDLSVETVIPLAGVVAAVVVNATGAVSLGVLSGVTVGAMVGLVNGLVIAKFRINALITTLATMQIVRGLSLIVCKGQAIGVTNEGFCVLGNTAIAGLPVPVWVTLGCFALFGLLLRKTTYGRNTLAIGGNEEAARLAGIAVDRIKITIFVVQGVVAATAGVLLASRMTSGQPNTSAGFSLDVIAACVLGGVSLSGGVGSILGTIVGVLIMATVQNVMNLLGIQDFYQHVVRGAILLTAVLFDRVRMRRS